jgi:hypothetical protein
MGACFFVPNKTVFMLDMPCYVKTCPQPSPGWRPAKPTILPGPLKPRALEAERKALQSRTENYKTSNTLSKQIGQLKAKVKARTLM